MIDSLSLNKNVLSDIHIFIDTSSFEKVKLNDRSVMHSLITFVWNLKVAESQIKVIMDNYSDLTQNILN